MNQRIKLIGEGAPVGALQWALRLHPELWDRDTARTAPPESPHHGLSDIWVRWAEPGVDGSKPHRSVWWPAADVLPVRDLVTSLVRAVGGESLGGVLITRIPPGGLCKPHSDPGWHARHYEKFAIQIESAPGQAFHFDGETLETKPGDVFWFNNAYTHWVTNESKYERITMIVCIRKEGRVN